MESNCIFLFLLLPVVVTEFLHGLSENIIGQQTQGSELGEVVVCLVGVASNSGLDVFVKIRINIVLMGRMGSGKSSFVEYVLEKADMGIRDSGLEAGTNEVTIYHDADNRVSLVDTIGLGHNKKGKGHAEAVSELAVFLSRLERVYRFVFLIKADDRPDENELLFLSKLKQVSGPDFSRCIHFVFSKWYMDENSVERRYLKIRSPWFLDLFLQCRGGCDERSQNI